MAILITGALTGFGEAMCRAFTMAGFNVVSVARRTEKLQALAGESGGNFYPLQMDVIDASSVPTALQSLPEGSREIDYLINNAGLALSLDSAGKADFADWQIMVQTNIVGLTSPTRQILPQMIERENGYIINIGSIAGDYPYPGGNVYGATKAFVYRFSLNLRADLAGTGIRITDIEPDLCGETEFSSVCFKGNDERAAEVYENIWFVRPEDIADTVLWLYHRPAHMNVNIIGIMPVAQSSGALPIIREIPPVPEPEEGFKKQNTSLLAKVKSWSK